MSYEEEDVRLGVSAQGFLSTVCHMRRRIHVPYEEEDVRLGVSAQGFLSTPHSVHKFC